MLGSLAGVKGNVRCTLHKLKGIKADVVCGNEEWRECDFKNLVEHRETSGISHSKQTMRTQAFNAQSDLSATGN